MADIKTVLVDMTLGADFAVTALGLQEDDGLETAVIISLFTDRRADADDTLPGGEDRRGWWADAYAAEAGDKIGSRLWLLTREKKMQSVLQRASDYAEEALQWMVADGVAKAVQATAFSVRDNVLGLVVEIRRGNDTARYRFENFWSA